MASKETHVVHTIVMMMVMMMMIIIIINTRKPKARPRRLRNEFCLDPNDFGLIPTGVSNMGDYSLSLSLFVYLSIYLSIKR